MKTSVMHRALLPIFSIILYLSLTGCPEIGNFSQVQSVISQDELVSPLTSTPNFLKDMTEIARDLGYNVHATDIKRQVVVFVKNPNAVDVGKALGGAWKETSVRLTRMPDKIVIEAKTEGNFGQVDSTSTEEVVRVFMKAIERKLRPATATARQ